MANSLCTRFTQQNIVFIVEEDGSRNLFCTFLLLQKTKKIFANLSADRLQRDRPRIFVLFLAVRGNQNSFCGPFPAATVPKN